MLTEAIVRAGIDAMGENSNRTEIINYIREGVDCVLSELSKKSRKVTDKRMLDVATISANNDKELGDIISKAYKAVGENGIVTVEKSQTSDTYAEITNGIKIDRGYTSPLFINNQRKDECIMDDYVSWRMTARSVTSFRLRTCSRRSSPRTRSC